MRSGRLLRGCVSPMEWSEREAIVKISGLNATRLSRCRSRAFRLSVIVVLSRRAALARFRQFRVCPPAFVGILLPIDRPDMRRVSIQVGARDPELLAVGVDPLPQNFARDPALRAGLAFRAHDISGKPVAIAAAAAPAMVGAVICRFL